jgi:hypothetical protein
MNFDVIKISDPLEFVKAKNGGPDLLSYIIQAASISKSSLLYPNSAKSLALVLTTSSGFIFVSTYISVLLTFTGILS